MSIGYKVSHRMLRQQWHCGILGENVDCYNEIMSNSSLLKIEQSPYLIMEIILFDTHAPDIQLQN